MKLKFSLKSNFLISAFFAAFLCLGFVSCSKNSFFNRNETIVFDDSEPDGISPQIKWALIVSPYAPVYKEAAFDSVVFSHERKGEILQVQGNKTTRFNGSTFKWIALKDGWVLESDVKIFPNKMRAKKACSEMD